MKVKIEVDLDKDEYFDPSEATIYLEGPRWKGVVVEMFQELRKTWKYSDDEKLRNYADELRVWLATELETEGLSTE